MRRFHIFYMSMILGNFGVAHAGYQYVYTPGQVLNGKSQGLVIPKSSSKPTVSTANISTASIAEEAPIQAVEPSMPTTTTRAVTMPQVRPAQLQGPQNAVEPAMPTATNVSSPSSVTVRPVVAPVPLPRPANLTATPQDLGAVQGEGAVEPSMPTTVNVPFPTPVSERPVVAPVPQPRPAFLDAQPSGGGGGEVVSNDQTSSEVTSSVAPVMPVPRPANLTTPNISTAAAAAPSSNALNRLAGIAWDNATKRRRVANFMGGGYRTGNTSKGMCSQAVRETLVSAGICRDYRGDALRTHTDGTLRNRCPGLQLSGSRNTSTAPAGSVIVYDGYAGNRRHNYGHIEIKIPVTQQLKNTMASRDPSLARQIRVGQFLYCSDFCRATPTKRPTNNVVAIYNLK